MDEDEKYAQWLQEQEIQSITADDARYAATLQTMGPDAINVSEFDDRAIALSLQDELRQHPHQHLSGSELDQLSRSTASALLRDEEAMVTEDDEALARTMHDNNAQPDPGVDTAIANTLQIEEVGRATQNDILLAQEIQQANQPDLSNDVAAAREIERRDREQATARDEAFARQLQDRQMAYQQQLDEDETLARKLGQNQGQRHQVPRMAHRGGFGQHQPHNPWGQTGHAPVHMSNPGTFQAVFHQMSDAAQMISAIQADGDIPGVYESLLELDEQIGDAQPRGLVDNQINALPTQTHQAKPQPSGSGPSGVSQDAPVTSKAAEDQDEDEQCKVCLSDFSSGETLRTLPCCHKYHKDCIDKWIRTNAVCPVCKLPLKEELEKVGIS